jgi:hypothetical protein
MLFLAACSRDHRQADIQRCVSVAEYQASHQLPPPPSDETADERHDRLGDLVVDCMEKHGYVENNTALANERCVDDVAFNPYCSRRVS